MSATTRHLSLWCDYCHAEFATECATVDGARSKAMEKGWQVPILFGVLQRDLDLIDRCPDCRKDGN